MLCTNGHNNSDTALYCQSCGVNTFQNTLAVQASQTSYSGLAIASLVLGIVWIYGVTSILALVFGYKAKRKIKHSGQKGAGLATAGIVLGWVGTAGAVAIVIAVLVFAFGGVNGSIPRTYITAQARVNDAATEYLAATTAKTKSDTATEITDLKIAGVACLSLKMNDVHGPNASLNRLLKQFSIDCGNNVVALLVWLEGGEPSSATSLGANENLQISQSSSKLIADYNQLYSLWKQLGYGVLTKLSF